MQTSINFKIANTYLLNLMFVVFIKQMHLFFGLHHLKINWYSSYSKLLINLKKN